jgi:hypothetical protein
MSARWVLAVGVGAFALGFAGTEAITQQVRIPQAAAEPSSQVKTEAIVMLQNDALLMKRAQSAEEIGLFLKGVRGVFDQVYTGADAPETINAAVVVKPGRKARVWIVSSLQSPPDRTALMGRFAALPAPEVKDGPVAFIIRLSVGGASEKIPLLPPEWTAAFEGKPAIMPDAITSQVWTD